MSRRSDVAKSKGGGGGKKTVSRDSKSGEFATVRKGGKTPATQQSKPDDPPPNRKS